MPNVIAKSKPKLQESWIDLSDDEDDEDEDEGGYYDQ